MADKIVLVKNKVLVTFVLDVFKHLYSIDSFDALFKYQNESTAKYTNKAKIIKLNDPNTSHRLTGLFIETSYEDISNRNASHNRWFTQEFKRNGGTLYLSNQWNSTGNYQLTLNSLTHFVKLAYGNNYDIIQCPDKSFEFSTHKSDIDMKVKFEDLTPNERIELFIQFGQKRIKGKTLQGYVTGLRSDFAKSIIRKVELSEDIFNINNIDDLVRIDEMFKKCRLEHLGKDDYPNYKNYASYSGKYLAFVQSYITGIDVQEVNKDDEDNSAKDFSIQTIIDNILSTGLLYSPNLIKRFVFSLMTKPFVILSGLAGSGKTQLALAFAKAMSHDESQYRIVSVGADWTNREPLLGFPNALNKDEYVAPENGVLQLLIDANKVENENKPYFLILDEMNLSYVERYFADFLSVMESHGSIPLWEKTDDSNSQIPPSVNLPKNLFIIGTINVDETTYMFSPKVLDRANVIEFKISSDEMQEFLTNVGGVNVESVKGKASSMGQSFVSLASQKELAEDDDAKSTLLKFFKELKSVNAEFGYRSATEIFRFISQAKKNDDSSEKLGNNEILDAAIVQKLLPKLHGSRKKLEPVLKALWRLCMPDTYKGPGIDLTKIDEAIYKESADKIARMYNAAQDNGFTSFAEA